MRTAMTPSEVPKLEITTSRMQDLNHYVSDLLILFKRINKSFFGLNTEDGSNPIREKASKYPVINYEIDKIVSVVYFMSILFIFTFALSLNLLPIDENAKRFLQDIIHMDDLYGQLEELNPIHLMLLQMIFMLSLGAVIYSIIRLILKLKDKINTTAVYLYAMGYQDVGIKEDVKTLYDSISNRDWATGERVAELLEERLYVASLYEEKLYDES
jgi:hypothetical protein